MKDYYSILEIPKTSTAEEIKKAYRKMAMKYHPDKNANDTTSEAKFKEVSEAYETLSNPEKRRKYDNPQTNPFNNLFNGANPFQSGDFSSFFEGSRKQEKPINRGRNINTIITLTLEEIVNGANKKIKLQRKVPCKPCNGTGAERGETISCPTCGGLGRVNKTVHHAFGELVMQETCRSCQGMGTLPRSVCITCSGLGTEKREEEVEMNIPKGSVSGTSFVLAAKGDWVKSPCNPGDLIVGVEEYVHKVFKRDGLNLICEKNLTFKEACLGTEVEFPNLRGSDLKIKIPEGTSPGKIFRVQGQGIPDFNSFGNGDILIKVNLKIPKDLTEDQIKALDLF